MTERPITELYAALVDWALANGAEAATSDLWSGETDQWAVKMNRRAHEIDDVPPYGYVLAHKTAFVGMAVGDPFGGAVAGATEANLIAHFRAATHGEPTYA